MSQTLNGRAPIEVTAHTSSATLTANDNGTCHTNTGASGAVVMTLPAASSSVGLHYIFAVRAAQALRIDPNGTDTISAGPNLGAGVDGGAPGAAGKYIGNATIGSVLHLYCAGGTNWCILNAIGAWVHES